MAEMKEKVRQMPRRAKVISALLACVLVITLIGVAVVAAAPIDIVPDDPKTVKINGFDLELSRPAPDPENPRDNSYPEYRGTIGKTVLEKWTCADGDNPNLTGFVAGYPKRDKTFDENTGVLKITNRGDKKISLSFHCEAVAATTKGSLTIRANGKDYLDDETKNFSKVSKDFTSDAIAPGASIEIWLTAVKYDKTGADATSVNLTISNIVANLVTGKTLNLLQPQNGSYTAVKLDKDGNTIVDSLVEVSENTQNTTIDYDPSQNESVRLTATDKEGYKFYLWQDENSTPLSKDATITVDGSSVAANSICPVFVSEGELGAPAYRIPDGKFAGDYYYWDDAMNAAGINFDKNVVLLQPLSLENVRIRNSADTAKTFTIPNGVTLVVPYSDKLSTGKEDAVNTSDETAAEQYGVEKDYNGTSVAFRTLTVPGNYTLNVNGTLLVNAVQGGKNGVSYQSHIVGTYGQMIVGGTVNVNSGGELYARGYITDLNHITDNHIGKINVNDGGSLIQMMQITDHRGGHYTEAVYQQLMPITMYYLQNNMVDTIYEYGSTMRAQAVLAAYTGTYDAVLADVRVIANGADKETPCMFVMDQDTAISTKYNYAEDKLHVTLDRGKVTMNFLQIDHPIMSINTAKNVLTISDNMPITVGENATLETNYDLKFLPGAELTVNGKLNINKGSDLYFYGATDYQADWSDNQFRTHIQPVGSIGNDEPIIIKEAKTTPETDAMLNLNGTLNLSGTLSQSTNHSGLLANAGEGAKIIINQPQKGGKSVNESLNQGCTSSPTPTSDITYVKADKYYYAVNKGWASLRGITVDGGESAVAFDQGTYQVHDSKWYSHKITVTYNMAGNTGTAPTATEVYTAKPEGTFTAPSGYVITGIDTGKTEITAANADTADSTPVSDGWKSVKLSNITAPEATLTATVKSYAHDVTWVRTTTEGGETKTTTTHSYLPSGTNEATLTFDGKVNIDASKVKIDGEAAGNRFASAVENGKTVVKVTGITQNTKIEVPYSSSNTVTWVVTTDKGDAVTTKAQTVAGSATYSLGNTESENWKVVELDGGVRIEQPDDSKAVLKARTDKTADITVTDVLQDITVKITVTTYKHKVTTSTTVYKAADVNKDLAETIVTFVNKDTYTPELKKIKTADKYVVSKYAIIGGTLGSKQNADVCAILPKDVSIALSGKDVVVSLELQSYLYVWNWDATLDNEEKPTPLGFTYTEYLTDRPTGGEPARPNDYTETPYYLTLRDYGEAGKYYHHFDKFAYEGYFGIDYRSMGNNRFAISGTQDGLPDYTGGVGEASLADGVLTETSWAGEITLKDEQAIVALVSYATKVTVKDGTNNGLPEGIFYADAEGKDVTSGAEIVYGAFDYNSEWDDYAKYLFVKGYTIGIDGAANPTTVDNVGALLGKRIYNNSLDGLTISAETVKSAVGDSNADLTVTLTDLAKYHQVYAVSEDGTNNFSYLMFVQSADKDGPSQIYAPKAEKFNVSCTRQTDKDGNVKYYPTLTVKDNTNYFFKDRQYSSADLGVDGKSLCGSSGAEPDQTQPQLIFVLSPYTASLTWNVGNASGITYVTKDGMAYCGLNEYKNEMQKDNRYSNGTWTYSGYTVPDGKTLAPNALQTNLCSASYDETTKNITVSNLNLNSTLTVVPSSAVTGADTYYMGDMSFEYVRNAAAFTWDGKTEGGGSWKPVNSFGWRHAVGSKSYEVGGKTLTVDNGSILFVNNTDRTVTYNVWLSRPGAETYGVSLDFDDPGDAVTVNNGAAAVTVQPNEQVTLVCRMTGTPNFGDKNEINIGTIKVTKN